VALTDLLIPILFGGIGVLLSILGLLVLKSAVTRFELLRQMFGDDADPVDIAAATPGTVAVEGTARPLDEQTIPLPFESGESVVAEGRTLEYSGGSEPGDRTKSTDEQATEMVPFVVDDGSGTVRVDPEDAARHWETKRFDPEEIDRAALEAWLQRTDVSSDSNVGYRQKAVQPGDEVYLFGPAVATDGGTESELRFAGDDLILSTEGRKQVGGSSLISGLILLFLGVGMLSFGVIALFAFLAFLLS